MTTHSQPTVEEVQTLQDTDFDNLTPADQILIDCVLDAYIKMTQKSDDPLEQECQGSVLPQKCNAYGDDAPLEEVIICDGISGGADYVEAMPRMLSLVKITPTGERTKADYFHQSIVANLKADLVEVTVARDKLLTYWKRNSSMTLQYEKVQDYIDLLKRTVERGTGDAGVMGQELNEAL